MVEGEKAEPYTPPWEEVYEIATAAARRCYRRFGRWVAFDDLRSAGLEYAVRRTDLVQDFLDREDPLERRKGIGALTKTLERAAERFARREKAAVLGYKPEDEYFYSEVTTEAMILAWGKGDVTSIGQVHDPTEMGGKRTPKPASEGNDLLAMILDIDVAMKKLDARTYGIVYATIVDDRTIEDVAESWGITHQRVSQIRKQGVYRVIDHLGGRKP